MSEPNPYPPIADYALISDCHSAALVSTGGSIDWLCMPRFDSGSLVGRLLDWERGGHLSIAPTDRSATSSRRYVDRTLVLETVFEAGGDEARVLDCFTVRRGGAQKPHRQLLRIVEGVRGRMSLRLDFRPRYDYGEVRPWIRRLGPRSWSAIGGDDALFVSADAEIEAADHDLRSEFTVRPGRASGSHSSTCAPRPSTRMHRSRPDRSSSIGDSPSPSPGGASGPVGFVWTERRTPTRVWSSRPWC